MLFAKDVAVEFRKFADQLDAHPDLEMDKPFISFYFWKKEQKHLFLNAARVMPRPFVKEHPLTDDGDLKLIYNSDAMRILTSLPKVHTCEIVEPARPAVYRCDPILSPEEDAELESK